jgi:hypothetical protein
LGSGESQERGIVGDTPNLAARLQSIAAPDSVVIAEGTRKLLGDLFELRDLGLQDLKGVGGPTQAWAALRPSAQESRFEALHAGGLTALVGRQEESELLLRRWAKAKATTTIPVAIPTRTCSGAWRRSPQLRRGLDDRKPGSHRVLGVVFMGLRIAEIGSTPSPMYFATKPPLRSIRFAQHLW